MQTQAQVPGQAPNQATRVQQNGSSVLSQSGNVVGSFKKAWHTEQDVSLRRGVCEQILHLFKKRKPHVTSEWQQKLPDFVKRLEEALYLNAGSKEEYSDTNTLERRLQAVAQTLPAKNQHVSNMANIVPNPGSASTMMPTPGATMMPTPGGGTGMMSGGNGLNSLQAPGNGHVMSAAGSGGSKVATSGSGGLMMPTPGIGSMMQTSGNGTVMQAGNTVIQSPGGIGGLVQGGNMGAPGHSNSISTGAMSKMMQATGHGSSMFSNAVSNILPNSGHPNSLAGQQVYSGMRIAPTQVAPGMSMPQTGSQMIPTPGLTGSQSMAPSVGGLSMANSGPQQHYTGPSSQTYRTLNGQLPTSLNGSLQRKNSSLGVPGINSGVPMMPNGQHLNLGANVHNASGYVNAGQFSNMSSQQQPLRVPPQRQPQHRLPGNGYSMNHSDMNGSGSLYPVTSSSGLVGGNMNLSAMVSQPSKMIPVPGLPQQQGILQQQLQQPQPQPQQLHMQGTSMQQNIGGMNRGQLSLQMSKGQGMFPQQVTTVSGQKQGGLMDQSQQSMTFQQASSDQHQPPRGQMSLSQSQQLQPLQHQGMQQNMGSHLQMRQMQQPRLQQPLQAQKQHQQHQQQQLPQVQAQHPPISSQQQQSVPVQQTQGQSQMQQQSQQAQSLPQLPTEQQQSQQMQVSQSLIAHQALAQRPLQQGQRSFTQGHQVLQRQHMLQEGGQQQQSHVHLQQPVSSPSSLVVGPGDENLNDDGSGSGNGNGSGSGSGSGNGNGNGNGPGNGNGDGNGSGSGNGNGNTSTNTNGPGTGPGPGNGNVQPVPGPDVADQRAQQYIKQRRWLLFLRHASKCQAPEGRCPTTPHCHVARQLWAHLSTCRLERDCTYTRCTATRTLVRHYQQCREPRCPVCAPVRQILQAQTRPQSSGQVQLGQNQVPLSSPQTPGQVTVGSPTMAVTPSATTPVSSLPAVSPQIGTAVQGVDIDGPPPAKRVKVESPGIQHQLGPSSKQVFTPSSLLNPMPRSQGVKLDGNPTVKTEMGSHPLRADSHVGNPLRQKQPSSLGPKPDSESTPGTQLVNVKAEPGSVFVKQQQGTPPAPATQVAPANSIKSGKPKIVGTSLTELFTPEQIREHIAGLRQWVGQSKAKAEKNQAMEQKMTENSCHLCAVEKLTFEPPPIYCTACGVRIKRNSSYYTLSAGETKHYCCTACHNECRTENVELDGISYPKIKLERRKNDEETEEAWVQCDSCNLWQHQVCALFNGRRNEGGEAEYICPQCLSSQMENGDRKPLPPSAVLGAKDMPKTFLSDHLESRLARKLDEERQERARLAGMAKEEVPGAEALVVRVVSCVDKKLEVKQRFLEMFQDEDYPSEFPYKSKVILLFQKIEGVEVCLFGMYVQEFGAECAHPNQRRVYLSYLDSVKYFRPDVKTVTGEALRTFVYHEILIGYLEHCKRRGFSSCYIWACPPLKGEDYILYCHPEIQKTPKSDKLREWYLTMLKKAAHESIVVEVTNLYDYFFISQGETKAKVTAARLPYFDGDYWPGAAEDMIVQLQQEEEDGRRLQKKGKPKKMTTTKRNAKVAGQAELPSNASDDTRLMHKLGDSIFPMKEDFIMVHMHFACSHCRMFIVTGKLWSCASCKFWLCNRCYENEQKVDERERHPTTSKEKHVFDVSFVTDVPTDTRDKDEIMESEFFDTRQAFLSLCQGNHYQYDTLRRAKHSSMMVLYHLHNPTAPAFVATCNSCNRDIDTGQGWRCETCVDFDLCHACKDTATHEHKLVMHSERNAQNKEARQMRVLQLRKMLDLLVHASQCGQHNQCNYPKCHSVKMLFRHGMYCAVRASGGCALCKRMWYLLQLHARACKEPVCRVPRCKDLKEHLRRLTQQAESRRRAAVNEMMRQRAAEAAGSTG